MIVVGVSPPAHESAMGVVADGRIVAAAAEERFTRIKNQGGFPARAFDAVLQLTGLQPGEIDVVALAWLPTWEEQRRNVAAYARNIPFSLGSDTSLRVKGAHVANYTRNVVRDLRRLAGFDPNRPMLGELERRGLSEKIRYVDHQAAHVASAYYASGFDRALGVSLDGYGSGAAGSFYLCENGRLKLLQRIPYPHSLGTFYRRITEALGFRANRHEGKIVGLAAFGDPSVLSERVLAGFDMQGEDHFRIKAPQDPYEPRRVAAAHPREDVAAAYQHALEYVAAEYIRRYLDRFELDRVVGAGGVFANVKMNQRIAEISRVQEIFVFPGMTDGGVGVGAALFIAGEEKELERRRLDHVYLGPGYTDEEIETALRSAGLEFQCCPEIEVEIARRIADGQVVARFDGRMEFGPRALGNRSILYSAEDPSVNQWLNQRLNRTEFMPFAPAVRLDDAPRLFVGVEKCLHTAEFMTITLDCTEEMRRDAPAAVHVDGTARPQLVTENSNPSFYRVLTEYKRLTGRSAVINTSFNMHEEPIVCSPADAVRAFMDGKLDCLAAGRFIVTNREAER